MNQIISNEVLLLSIHNGILLPVTMGALYSFCIKLNNCAVLKEDSQKIPLVPSG